MEERSQILEGITTLFFKYGARSVTMDDIARNLGKSKKTIYQFFQNKEEIVQASISCFINANQKAIQKIKSEKMNAIDEWKAINEFNFQFISNLNPALIYDLKKYYGSSWSVFEQHKQHFVVRSVSENLKKGIEEGLYRKNILIPIVAQVFVYKMDLIFDLAYHPEVNTDLPSIYKEIMKYHLHAIVSDKGLKYLNDHKIFDDEK